MKRISVLILSVAVVAFGVAGIAQAPVSEVDAHVAAASAAAGLDFRNTFINLCLAGGGPQAAPAGGAAGRRSGDAGPRHGRRRRAAPAGQPAAGRGEPAGAAPDARSGELVRAALQGLRQLLLARHASAFVVGAADERRASSSSTRTSPGPPSRRSSTGMTKLGLNPRDIKYVIISHAHGDHDQGAAELQKRFGAKVVMGAADWDATLQRPATAAGGVPTRDISVGPEGCKLTLGDTTVDILATPGHTPGTLSYVFPVKNQGQRVMVAYSGGTLTGAFGTNGATLGRIHRLAAARSRRPRPMRARP